MPIGNPKIERNKAVISLYLSNDTYFQIAFKLNISRSAVAGIIYRYHMRRLNPKSSYYNAYAIKSKHGTS